MPTARYLASQLLVQCERSRSYVNLSLDAALSRAQLNPADAGLCAALMYGVIERRRTLDYQLRSLLAKPLKQLPAETRAALRLGLYQLFFMQRIPPHAAIHESVELVKASQKSRHTAGLVNAVLRKAQGQGIMLPQGDDDEALSVRYAVPKWLVALWRASYSDDYLPLLEQSFGGGTTTLRVNTTKTGTAELMTLLDAQEVPGLPHALHVQGGDVTHLPGFAQGLFHVQDGAAQLCCEALGAQVGETVFDLCAAPGGKSFTLAQMMQNQGQVVAMDLHQNRVRLIKQGAQRLGLNCIEAVQGNANDAEKILASYGQAQRVLCDVPCSGLGILRKKPDIREKLHAELDKLPQIQYNILCVGARLVSPDGSLIYATCTLNPAENELVCRRFLAEHPQYIAEQVLPDTAGLRHEEGFLTLMPHRSGTDGFFIAKFCRK